APAAAPPAHELCRQTSRFATKLLATQPRAAHASRDIKRRAVSISRSRDLGDVGQRRARTSRSHERRPQPPGPNRQENDKRQARQLNHGPDSPKERDFERTTAPSGNASKIQPRTANRQQRSADRRKRQPIKEAKMN